MYCQPYRSKMEIRSQSQKLVYGQPMFETTGIDFRSLFPHKKFVPDPMLKQIFNKMFNVFEK
jgi:hypothetical protein